MLELMTCELCYVADLDVRVALAWYADTETREPVQSIARCPDADACRRRVEDRGERWPLIERERGSN